ncbi:hypothetical protein ACHAXR_005949, partial [Thalassiosira sp. AJA248-18]
MVVSTRQWWRQQRRSSQQTLSLLAWAICCCLSGVVAKTQYLRHSSRYHKERRRAYQSNADTTAFECPPSYSGYYPAPGCNQYYYCDYGSRLSSVVYSCTEGLLFDETLGLCNWKAGVTCSLEPVEPTTSPPTTEPTPSPPPTTTAPTRFTFQKKIVSHGKEIIGYWHGDTVWSSSTTPDQIDYAKLTRINYATYATNELGKLYMKGNHGPINREADVVMLLGPHIWNPMIDERAKEYCHSNPGNDSVACTHHDYKRGMLYLAHVAGVEVFPSITLDLHQSLLRLDKEEFARNAILLLDGYGFDGLDINFQLPSVNGAEQRSAAVALQSLLTHLRHEIVKLMYTHGRYYGLTVAMPCSPDLIEQHDISEIAKLADSLNIYSFDLNTAKSSTLAAPQAPLFKDPNHGVDYSVHSCVSSYVVSGVPQKKMNVGLSFYGQTYKGTTEMYTKHEGIDTAHWVNADTDRDGSVPYHSIYPRMASKNRIGSLTTVREDVTKTVYAQFEHNGVGKGLVSYENEESICEKAEYVLINELNGHFIWELTGDILEDRSTPLLDIVNLKLNQPKIDCENYASGIRSSAKTGTIENDEKSTRSTGKYGPPRYYPSFAHQSCSDDEQTKPSWVTQEHMFRSKSQCCEELFGLVDLEICLGKGFMETNTVSPSHNPTSSPTTALPSARPTYAPSNSPSQRPSNKPTPSKIGVEPKMISSPNNKPIRGLCANDESELPQIFRTAQSCSDDQPCPAGLQCFRDIDFRHGNDRWRPPTKALTSHPTGVPTAIREISIQADADATLSENDTNNSYGFHPMLVVDGRQGEHYDTLLKFDISLLETVSMDNVVLKVFVKDGSGYCGTFTTMSNTWWTESSVTWATLQSDVRDNGIVIGQAYNTHPGEWIGVDVTGSLNWALNEKDKRATKTYLGIRISSTVDNRCIFSSSNGLTLHAPHLRIKLKAVEESINATPPPTPPPTVSQALTAATKPISRVTGETVMLRAIDDATIVKEKPNENFGQEASLVADHNGNSTKDVLIQFDLGSNHGIKPKKAVLAMFIEENCESAGIFM